MLVLDRKRGPSIRVCISGIGKDRVALAIDAPPDVQVTRPDIKVKEPK